MSRPYNNGFDANLSARQESTSGTYDQSRSSRPGPQLPSPEGLVAGAPSGHSSKDNYPLPHFQSHPHPPTRPPHTLTHAHQPSYLGPSTYTQHSPPPLPPYYDALVGSNRHPQHYRPPSHVSPSPSQASTASTASFPDLRHHRVPPAHRSSQHSHPDLGHPHPPQQSDNSLQPRQSSRRIAPSTSSTMGQILSRTTAKSSTPVPPIGINLLGEDRADDAKNIQFCLKLRQQPRAARSCGFGDRDRRVIDPPPIVELQIQGPKLRKDDINKYLRYHGYIMSVSIYDETGTHDASIMPEEYRNQRRLMGSLVASPFFGKDEFERDGCFFPFPDLSCRTPGPFRLHFHLVMLAPNPAQVGRFPKLTETVSDVFTVYNAKDFPGMEPSTGLARRLKEQGCIIAIKKGADRGDKFKLEKLDSESFAENDEDDDSGNEDDGKVA